VEESPPLSPGPGFSSKRVVLEEKGSLLTRKDQPHVPSFF